MATDSVFKWEKQWVAPAGLPQGSAYKVSIPAFLLVRRTVTEGMDGVVGSQMGENFGKSTSRFIRFLVHHPTSLLLRR